jgi:carbon-monoxide dehydrogenase large subunit
MPYVGQPVRRSEDRRLLTGRGRFVADIAPPGTLPMAVVRSPHAHARVLGVSLEAARSLSGAAAAAAARDLGPAGAMIPLTFGHPGLVRELNGHPLAAEVVRYVGEPVAAVVASCRAVAEDAAELVRVDYRPLPAAADLESAAAPGAPLVHPEADGNVAGTMRQVVGDPASAFAAAPHRVKLTLRIDRGSGQPMETRGVLAVPEPGGGLTVWATTQAPHRFRGFLSRLLALPEDRLRVVVPDVGGAFGLKGNFYPEDLLVPWFALRLGRPVTWIEDRRENFLATTQERLQVHRVEAAVDDGGRVLALRDEFLHDMGAYAPYGLTLPQNAMNHSVGPYAIRHLDLRFTAVYTHRVPTAAYRGAGRPEGAYVAERVMDAVADELGIDRVEVRERNLIRPGQHPFDTGLAASGRGPIIYESGDYPRCLREAVEALDYAGVRRQQARLRAEGRHLGVAVVNYVEATGTLPYEGATVRVDAAGNVVVATGAAPQGQGHQTVLAQICADRLGVPIERVSVRTGDTAAIPFGIGTFGSRTAIMAGNATAAAAGQVRSKALRVAARLLEAADEDLEWLGDGVGVRGAPQRRASLAQLAQAAARAAVGDEPPGLEATAYWQASQASFASGSHAAVVEVDPATGEVRLLRYVVVHDVGRAINPLLVDGQVHGGVAQGLGGALYERLACDPQGQPLTATFMDYLLPTAMEVPRLEVHEVVGEAPLNPLGVKGAGEGGAIPVYALVAAAVEDALKPSGIRVTDLPLTPDELWRRLAAAPAGDANDREE